MKRLIIITIIALLGLQPAVETAFGLNSGIEWCASAHAGNKKKKDKKKHRQSKKRKSRDSASGTVPLISSLAGTAASGAKAPLLSVTVPQGNQRVDYKAITVYFNRSLRIPVCVAYELTSTMVTMADSPGAEKRRNHKFYGDPNVAGSPDWGDYRKSGYTRGHMAPAMDMRWDRQAMAECFLMTNICPQDKSLNEGGWNRLEEKAREWARRDSALIIAAGPIIEHDLLRTRGGVAMPRRFYKVILAHHARPLRAIAFIYPNSTSNGPLRQYAVSVDSVERLTGIDFFGALPDDQEDRLERSCSLASFLQLKD